MSRGEEVSAQNESNSISDQELNQEGSNKDILESEENSNNQARQESMHSSCTSSLHLSKEQLSRETREQAEARIADYIKRMCQLFEDSMNEYIVRLEFKDMMRRQIKSKMNDDRLFDLL